MQTEETEEREEMKRWGSRELERRKQGMNVGRFGDGR